MQLPGLKFTTYQPGDLGRLTFLNLGLLVLKIGDDAILLCRGCSSEIRRTGLSVCPVRERDLNVLTRGRNEAEKRAHCMILFIYYSRKCKVVYIDRTQTSGASWTGGAKE